MSKESVDREVVSVGLDFRPLPIDMGDGTVWKFDPDPDPSAWHTLAQSLAAFSSLKDAGSATTEEEMQKVGEQVGPLLAGLTSGIAGLLIEVEQRQAFMEAGYGMLALRRLAEVLMEQMTGFPTE